MGALAALSSVAIANPAQAAEANPDAGLKVSGEWTPGTPAPVDKWVDTKKNPNTGLAGFIKPTSVLDATTKIGDVGVRVEFARDENRAEGTGFLLTGPRSASHAAYKGQEQNFFEGSSVLNAKALDMLLIADPSCVPNATKPADVLNFIGTCKYGTLTFKFDRPVSDPILDFSGFGGNNTGAIAYAGNSDPDSYNYAFIRTSSSNNTFALTTPGAKLELITEHGEKPTNAKVEENSIKVAETDLPVSHHCNPVPMEYEGNEPFRKMANMRLADRHQAGCGSLRVAGNNLEEISFDVYLNVTNVKAWREGNKAGRSFTRDGLEGMIGSPTPGNAVPDGFNGAFRSSSMGSLAFTHNMPFPSPDHGDIARMTLRLPEYSVGDYVWFDENEDGVQDTTETPVQGVTVELLNEDGTPVLNPQTKEPIKTTTNEKGKYVFNGLSHGVKYKLRFTPPEEYVLTEALAGGEAAENNSKADQFTRTTAAFEFERDAFWTDPTGSKKINLNLDAGLIKPEPAMELEKWIGGERADKPETAAVVNAGEQNKITFQVRNTGNVPLNNVAVTDTVIKADAITAPAKKYDADGKETADWDGILKPGESAFFTADLPGLAAGESHKNTATAVGTPNSANDNPAQPISVSDDAHAEAAKLVLKKYINGDDAQDAPGVAVEGNEMEIKYVVSNPSKLAISDIRVTDTVTAGTNQKLQEEIQEKLKAVPAFTLQPNEEKEIKIQVKAPAAGEANNHRNEAFAEGLPVQGKETLAPGEVNVVPPRVPMSPVIKPVRSDVDAAHAMKLAVSLGDFVWLDADKDGVQDNDEQPLPGVTVALLDANGEPVRAADGEPLVAKTNSEGKYLFENLNPGTYKVRFQAPVGYAFTEPGRGEADNNSKADTATGETPAAEVLKNSNLTFDAGLYKLVPGITVVKKINGYDANTPEAAAQVAAGSEMTVSFLVKNTGETTLNDVKVADDTIDAKNIVAPTTKYAADGADAGKYVGVLNPGEYVVYTAKAPAPAVAGGIHKNTATATGVPPFDVNDQGIDPQNPPTVQDQDDANAVAPKLSLRKLIKDANLAGAGADANTVDESVRVVGDKMTIEYEVTNESTVAVKEVRIVDRVTMPEKSELQNAINSELAKVAAFELPPLGTKTVAITVSAPAPGEQHANYAKAVGNVVLPDVPPATTAGEPAPVTQLPPLESAEDSAHAHKPLAKLGDKVWVDVNNNGVQEADEKPLPGVQVHLLNAAGEPVVKDSKPVIVATNEAGEYLFEDLLPGDYKVRFELPEGYVFTAKHSGDDKSADSDADSRTGITDVVSLGAGESNLTVDAGVVPEVVPPVFTPAPSIDVEKYINDLDADTVEAAAAVKTDSTMVITFKVTNTGNTLLKNITLTDDVIPADKITARDGFAGELAPGEVAWFDATLPAPAAQKLHKNTATVTGVPFGPDGVQLVNPNDPTGAAEWVLTDADSAHAIGSDSATPITPNGLAQTGGGAGIFPIVGLLSVFAGATAAVVATRRRSHSS